MLKYSHLLGAVDVSASREKFCAVTVGAWMFTWKGGEKKLPSLFLKFPSFLAISSKNTWDVSGNVEPCGCTNFILKVQMVSNKRLLKYLKYVAVSGVSVHLVKF